MDQPIDMYSIAPPALDKTCLLSTDTKKGPHYTTDRLTSEPTPYDLSTVEDVLAYALMLLISWISTFLAVIHTFQPLENHWTLGLIAVYRSPWEVIFLRRILILEGLAWVHGLAAAYIDHVKSCFFIHRDELQGKTGMISLLLAELQSHRCHLVTFLDTLQPGLPLRALTPLLQALVMLPYLATYFIYPSLCHALARMLALLTAELYSEAIERFDLGQMHILSGINALPSTIRLYGLKDDATWRDVVLCFRADELWHASFNQTCSEATDEQTLQRLSSSVLPPKQQ